MTGIASKTLTCASLLLLTACAGFDSAPPTACVPHFPYAEGWLGADAAYSIPIGDSQSIWLFGDTFVGEPGQLDRRDSQFIHNSIGISRCSPDGGWEIDYAWATAADGSARAMFDVGQHGTYWWLFDGFMFDDALYVGLLGVEQSEPRGPLKLPFRYSGMKLARVENHREDPARWQIEILPLSESRVAFPGAMVVEGEHVYLFSFVDRDGGHYPRILGRFPVVALAGGNPGDGLEYFARDRLWRTGFDPDDAMILMDDDASEMSVHYHAELGEWVAVYSFPPSNTVTARTAKHLEGPWSEPRSIFSVPELSEDSLTSRDPATACYAAKEHPEYAPKGTMLFTYVCNLFTGPGADAWDVLSRLVDKMYLYHPRVVSIPFPNFRSGAPDER